jgi:putative transferase (TIGR04331 family)
VESSIKNKFIALTAMEEYWDTSEEIVFLGEWCKIYTRKKYWDSLIAETMPSWIETNEQVCDTINNLDIIYEKLLPYVGKELNRLHNENHSIRYWRILVGPWLLHHIGVYYDRYKLIKKAIKMYPGFKTLGLHPDNYLVPSETLNYISLSVTDKYNLQIFSDIMTLMGHNFKKMKYTLQEKENISSKKSFKFKFRLKYYLKQIITITFNKLSVILYKNNLLVINKVYLPFPLITWLRGKTKGKLVHYEYDFNKKGIEHGKPNYSKRSKIKVVIETSTEFEKLLIKSLNSYIPCCFIEDYEQIGKSYPNYFPKAPRVIWTPSLMYNEIFKHWAANCSAKGTKLVGLQHGGANFLFKEYQTEEHDLKINDIYYSWGGSRKKYETKIKPLPVINFMNRHELGANNNLNDILFATTMFPRYLKRFWLGIYSCYNFNQYINQQFRFVDNLCNSNRKNLVIRPFQEDHGWDYKDRLSAKFPDVKLNTNGTFFEKLAECKIFICDNIQTVWLESLWANKPTVMYLDFDKYSFTVKASHYLNQLKSVSILHDSPEKAAETINNVYDDVEEWWNDSTLQRVKEEFCENYARKSGSGRNELASSINSIIN